jgi:hypothetical protein
MFDDDTLNKRHGETSLKGDTAFIAAEQKIAEMERQGAEIMAAGAGDYPDEITLEIADLREQIAQSPPASVASATVKLRDLLRPEVGFAELGLPSSERESDVPSLRQILAFLETETERRRVERLAVGGIEDDPVLALITERARLWGCMRARKR